MNETNGTRGSLIIRSPTTEPGPMVRLKMPVSPCRFITVLQMFCTAMAVSGVDDDGFHTVVSPQTAASAAFHAHTATGKLNAEMTPTTPSGCHCSYMRWRGRSDIMVGP